MCYFFLFFKRNIVFKKIKQNICEWRPMGHKQSREVGEVLRDRQTHCWCCVVFLLKIKKIESYQLTSCIHPQIDP